VTRHGIVRTLLLIGWKLMVTAKGAADVTMIGAERPDTTGVAVILGVDTHLDFHVAWAWTIWAEKPGRVERASDREGLRKAPPLGGTFWPPQVRRGRRYKQLRGRTRPPLEGQGDRGA
jgi:hypothetical protein